MPRGPEPVNHGNVKGFSPPRPSGKTLRDTISEQYDSLDCQIANVYRIRFFDSFTGGSH
jgi:hypothetical protein